MTGFRKALLAAVLWSAATPAIAQDPRVVSGGNADPACFAPWRESTRLLRFETRPGPYRIALANGYIANGWRRQMIRTAKAYAAKPEVATQLREFRIVSTGEDVSAQLAAINGFIDAGFDAILVDAENPDALRPVIERARKAGVILVAFDNTLDSDEAINVNVDQKGLGRFSAEWIVRTVPNGGRILEVRGPAGLTVDRDRHDGVHEVLTASGRRWDVVAVNGNVRAAVRRPRPRRRLPDGGHRGEGRR